MHTHENQAQDNKNQAEAREGAPQAGGSELSFQFADNRPEAGAQKNLQDTIDNSPRVRQLMVFQNVANNATSRVAQRKANETGLPDNLKSGVESLSGHSLDDVKVHYNSRQPAQFLAHAYAQGTDIFLGPGQERHLPHEAWHVVQQKQGRVLPTKQLKGKDVNDDAGLEKEADVMGAKAGEFSIDEHTRIGVRQLKGAGEVLDFDNLQIVSHEGAGVIQGEFGDAVAWATATGMTRSGAGAEGVLFVTLPAGRIIVKFLDKAAGPVQADKTLEAAGIEIPQSGVFPNANSNPTGAAIRTTVNAHLASLSAAQQVQVTNQLNNYAYIQVQEMAAGTPLDQFTAGQVQAFINNPALMKEVGKIAAVDSFMGNTDRLSKTTVNTGNYILGGATGSTLIAIDNELKAGKGGNKAQREGEVRFVMSQAGVDLLTQNFLMRLSGGGTKYMFSVAEEAAAKLSIGEGVLEGAQSVIDLIQADTEFINDAKTNEKTVLPGPQGTKTANRQIVRKTLKARLAALREGLNTHDITTALDDEDESI